MLSLLNVSIRWQKQWAALNRDYSLPLHPVHHTAFSDMLRNLLFASRRFSMPCSSFLCKLIKDWRSRKDVKHPSYCLFTRESRALEYRFGLHNWRFMSQKAKRTRYFPRVCLAWLRKLLLCRLNLYVGGLCGSVTVDSNRLIIKTTPRNKS